MNNILKFILLCFSFCFSFELTLAQKNVVNGSKMNGVIFSYKPTVICNFQLNEYKYAREPVLRRMPDNSLMCLHYTGGPAEPDDANVIVATRSTDNGESWSQPQVLFDHHITGVWGPELFVEGKEVAIPVHTFHTSSHYDKLKVYLSESPDSGKTWKAPVSFPGFVNGFSFRRGIVLSNGEWFFPIYCQEPTEGFWTEPRKHYTFATSAMTCKPGWKDIQVHGYHKRDDLGKLWEPNAIEISPGHIAMLMRASGTNVLYRTDSYDWGRSWTKAGPTDIPNGDSKITILKVRDKIVLLGNQLGNRSRVDLWVSGDGMETWEKKIVLAQVDDKEPKPGKICYPDGFIDLKEQTLFISLDQYSHHYLIKVPFKDFM